MNFFKLFLLNFCPINIFRPVLEERLPHILKFSMINVFNKFLDDDPKKYNQKFREIYEISDEDDVYIFNYHRFEHYFNKNLKEKDLSYSTLKKINKYGCIYRTDVPILRGLGKYVEDKVLEHSYLYHTLIIIAITVFSCLLSSLQLFKNEYLQFFFCTTMIIVPHFMVFYMLDAGYLALTVTLVFCAFIVKYLFSKPWEKNEDVPWKNGFIHYVNFTRGSLIVAIIIAILAVDNIYFNQFMRKTYYDGFSAMDIGAGFFVTQTGASIALSKRKKTLWVIIKKNLIILFIGIARTVTTTLFKIDVDVREYGKHWNFFYTLVLTRMGIDIINTYCHKYVVYALPFLITVIYEVVLVATKAIEKLPQLERSNFIYANREGFLSIPNSLSGSLFVLLVTKIAVHYYKKGKTFHAYLTYMFTSTTFFLLTNLLYFTGLKSSRSMNNLRFLSYVMALYNFSLATSLLFEMIYPKYIENKVIGAAGKYPLMVYVIANLLTGFVNIVFKPYLFPLTYFIIILLVYAYIPFSLGLLFKRLNLKAMSQWL